MLTKPNLFPLPDDFVWFSDHTALQRLSFIRTAREVLRTGRHEDGREVSASSRELIEGYLAREVHALRPRLVVSA